MLRGDGTTARSTAREWHIFREVPVKETQERTLAQGENLKQLHMKCASKKAPIWMHTHMENRMRNTKVRVTNSYEETNFFCTIVSSTNWKMPPCNRFVRRVFLGRRGVQQWKRLHCDGRGNASRGRESGWAVLRVPDNGKNVQLSISDQII